ncbi:hypothetical protein [uncultured Tenacibaculum sp.]|uniref:helix-turn-helix transcriptional regulator n=1 Tax=uncultured Tenacibaculum sp. TaxID=174713 RepID=UPI00261FD366|nr:hypothetical protein [uncultured Tenacibaculum sp.]
MFLNSKYVLVILSCSVWISVAFTGKSAQIYSNTVKYKTKVVTTTFKDIVQETFKPNVLQKEKENQKQKKDTEIVISKFLYILLVAILIVIIAHYLIKLHYKKRNHKNKFDFLQKEAVLKETIKNLSSKVKEQETLLNEQKEELRANKQVKKLHDKIIDKILTQEDWYSFKEKFNQVYPLFFRQIQEKDIHLTKSEERLIALEKLGLDNTEIANVLGISVDSVFVNRYRLRKKIKAPASISIVEFLS